MHGALDYNRPAQLQTQKPFGAVSYCQTRTFSSVTSAASPLHPPVCGDFGASSDAKLALAHHLSLPGACPRPRAAVERLALLGSLHRQERSLRNPLWFSPRIHLWRQEVGSRLPPRQVGREPGRKSPEGNFRNASEKRNSRPHPQGATPSSDLRVQLERSGSTCRHHGAATRSCAPNGPGRSRVQVLGESTSGQIRKKERDSGQEPNNV